MSAMSLTDARERFTSTISAVDEAARFAFRRRLRPQDYEEAVAEARAAAWTAWLGLIGRGKDPVEVGVHGIAANAIRCVRNGRKVGNATFGRGAMDVFSRKAQAKDGFAVVSLESGGGAEAGDSARRPWRERLSADDKVTPADEAAFRIDFESWLAGLPARKRRVAELLAEGREGVVVAGLVGLSPGRVCQLRDELKADWWEFQRQTRPEPGRSDRNGEAATGLGRP